MRRIVLIGLTIGACSTIGIWALSERASSTAAAADGASPAPAKSSKPIELKECLIKAVKTARLATDRPGVLAEVQPQEGDNVRKGQPVARLIDEVAQANLAVANLVAEDRVEIEYAVKLNQVDAAEYAKALDANQQHANTVPDIEVLRLKLAEQKSRLQIDKAQHEMAVNKLKARQSDAELKTYRILAPFDGVVNRVQRFPGEGVKQGDTILEMVNTAVVRVEGDVPVNEIWNVQVGSPVTVRLSIRDADLPVQKQVFHGQIGFVDVVADLVTQKTRIWAEVPNPDNVLRPGLKATMTILPAAETASRVPAP